MCSVHLVLKVGISQICEQNTMGYESTGAIVRLDLRTRLHLNSDESLLTENVKKSIFLQEKKKNVFSFIHCSLFYYVSCGLKHLNYKRI